MLGFIIGFWSTPTMTLGHVVFALGTTAYILIAIQTEERDLVLVHGARYEQYQRQVSLILPFPKIKKAIQPKGNVRLFPENKRVFALALVAGAVSGLAAVLFHLSIIGAKNRLIEGAMHASGRSWIWWTIFLPTIGGLVSGILLQFVVPGARGSGVPQIKVACAIKGGRVPFIDAIGVYNRRNPNRHRIVIRARRSDGTDLYKRP